MINSKIYMITNEVNGLRYIGQTINSIEERFRAHKKGTRQPKKYMSKLQKAMDLYGKPSFKIELIEDNINDIEKLASLEKFYIEKFGTINEYNSSAGGESKLRKLNTNKEKKIFRLSNNLQEISLRELSTVEQNVFWAIIKLITNKGCEPLYFQRDDFDKITKYNENNLRNKDFIFIMKDLSNKINFINISCQNSMKISIQISPYFVPWFNDIQKNFTRIDLSVLIGLKSGYSKELYRFFMRWKEVKKGTKLPGCWSVSIDEFKRLMCIPESYNLAQIRRKILDVAKKELTTENKLGFTPLEHLEIIEKVKPGTKKKIIGFEFNFKQGKVPKEVIKVAEEHTEELLELGAPSVIHETPYSNNFENGYIPGENSPVKNFKKWLEYINLFNENDEYFGMRSSAKKDFISLYKEKVIDNENKYWTDMRFFACALFLIKKNKAMTVWNLEDAYATITENNLKKRINVPLSIYQSLPQDKMKQLEAFVTRGEVI